MTFIHLIKVTNTPPLSTLKTRNHLSQDGLSLLSDRHSNKLSNLAEVMFDTPEKLLNNKRVISNVIGYPIYVSQLFSNLQNGEYDFRENDIFNHKSDIVRSTYPDERLIRVSTSVNFHRIKTSSDEKSIGSTFNEEIHSPQYSPLEYNIPLTTFFGTVLPSSHLSTASKPPVLLASELSLESSKSFPQLTPSIDSSTVITSTQQISITSATVNFYDPSSRINLITHNLSVSSIIRNIESIVSGTLPLTISSTFVSNVLTTKSPLIFYNTEKFKDDHSPSEISKVSTTIAGSKMPFGEGGTINNLNQDPENRYDDNGKIANKVSYKDKIPTIQYLLGPVFMKYNFVNGNSAKLEVESSELQDLEISESYSSKTYANENKKPNLIVKSYEDKSTVVPTTKTIRMNSGNDIFNSKHTLKKQGNNPMYYTKYGSYNEIDNIVNKVRDIIKNENKSRITDALYKNKEYLLKLKEELQDVYNYDDMPSSTTTPFLPTSFTILSADADLEEITLKDDESVLNNVLDYEDAMAKSPLKKILYKQKTQLSKQPDKGIKTKFKIKESSPQVCDYALDDVGTFTSSNCTDSLYTDTLIADTSVCLLLFLFFFFQKKKENYAEHTIMHSNFIFILYK